MVSEARSLAHALFPETKHAVEVRIWFHASNHDPYFLTLPGQDDQRPGIATPIDNLYLAGDYTANSFRNVGMEGAVVSPGSRRRTGSSSASAARRAGSEPMREPGGLVPALRALLHGTGTFERVVGYREWP